MLLMDDGMSGFTGTGTPWPSQGDVVALPAKCVHGQNCLGETFHEPERTQTNVTEASIHGHIHRPCWELGIISQKGWLCTRAGQSRVPGCTQGDGAVSWPVLRYSCTKQSAQMPEPTLLGHGHQCTSHLNQGLWSTSLL